MQIKYNPVESFKVFVTVFGQPDVNQTVIISINLTEESGFSCIRSFPIFRKTAELTVKDENDRLFVRQAHAFSDSQTDWR